MKYRELHGYKYQLLKDELVTLSTPFGDDIETEYVQLHKNLLLCKKHYACDGPSGPTFDTPDAMRASLAHDALWQLIAMGLVDKKLKRASDRELRVIGLKDGMARWRVNLWYWVLGFVSVESRNNSDKVYEL